MYFLHTKNKYFIQRQDWLDLHNHLMKNVALIILSRSCTIFFSQYLGLCVFFSRPITLRWALHVTTQRHAPVTCPCWQPITYRFSTSPPFIIEVTGKWWCLIQISVVWTRGGNAKYSLPTQKMTNISGISRSIICLHGRGVGKSQVFIYPFCRLFSSFTNFWCVIFCFSMGGYGWTKQLKPVQRSLINFVGELIYSLG